MFSFAIQVDYRAGLTWGPTSRGERTLDRAELQEKQAPLKERYKEEPGAALITLSARASLGEGISCSVETGRAIAEAGLHPATGGDGTQLCSGDMLLEALAACAGVTLRSVATSLEIPVRRRDGQGGRRPRLQRDARRRPRGGGWLLRDQPCFRPRYGRRRGAARHAHQADRALLRRPADALGVAGAQRHAEPPELGGLCSELSVDRKQRRA